jgi:hypothetical protein
LWGTLFSNTEVTGLSKGTVSAVAHIEFLLSTSANNKDRNWFDT